MGFTRIESSSLSHPISSSSSSLKSSALISTPTPFHSGIPSFDSFFFNSQPISSGSIILLLEDRPRSMASAAASILKCFMAQAVNQKKQVTLVSDPHEGLSLAKNLPSPVLNINLTNETEAAKDNQNEMKMSIAWRYKHLMQVSDDINPTSKHFATTTTNSLTFDLSKIQSSDFISLKTFSDFSSEISTELIVFYSVGSPWHQCAPVDFAHYLLGMKGKSANIDNLTKSPSLFIVSTPSTSFFNVLLPLADLVLELYSLDLLSTKKFDIDGLIKLRKPVHLPGSLMPIIPSCTDLAYKTRRRRFFIDTFALPPEDAVIENESKASSSIGGCGFGLSI